MYLIIQLVKIRKLLLILLSRYFIHMYMSYTHNTRKTLSVTTKRAYLRH